MAFDGPMLAASVVSALAAVPSAIRSVLDILNSGKPDTTSAAAKLSELRGHLVDVCGVEASLREAKEIHDVLHRLDTELETVAVLYRGAIAHGPFNQQVYSIPKVHLTWECIKKRHFIELFAKARSLEYVNLKPLELDGDGRPVGGPDWACRFADFRTSIDRMFQRYNDNKLRDVHDLADLMEQLIEHVKTTMYEANERILSEGLALGDALRECRAALGSA